jgi:uncharacterized protein
MVKFEFPQPDHLSELALQKKSANLAFVKKIKKKKSAGLDVVVHDLHNNAFEQYSCLSCANCCKSISPIITYKDIRRISKTLGMKPGDFKQTYLEMDEEGDFVFRSSPCPFLQDDNHCSVYSVRPKACKEYPHTNRVNFAQILNLSVKNTGVCPVVYAIFEVLRTKF